MTATTPKYDRLLARVKSAVRKAWEECGEVPFPLYDREAEAIARAAIEAMEED